MGCLEEIGLGDLLGTIALVLGIINGVALFAFYLRDRPRVHVSFVHPDESQTWVRLPDGDRGGTPTRRWAFFAYVAFGNRGLRKTSIVRWRLRIRSRHWRSTELLPMNMPNPVAFTGTVQKILPVLGQMGQGYDGRMAVEAGESISGMAHFVYEVGGAPAWNPQERDERITATFIATDVHGYRHWAKVVFRKKHAADIAASMPGITEIWENC